MSKLLRALKKTFIILLAITVIDTSCPAVRNAYALSEELLDKYSANNIMFYDGEEGECEESGITGMNCVAPTGDQITYIGDSLTALAGKNVFEEVFPGADYGPSFNDNSSYVRSGKAITKDMGDMGGPSGLGILQKIVNEKKLRPYLIFALGANEPWTKELVKQVMDVVGSNTQVLILTSKFKSGELTTRNNNLREGAKAYSNITIGDWASEVKDDYFNPNDASGVHYTAAGHKAYLEFIKKSLPTNCSGACGAEIEGNDNKSRTRDAVAKYGGVAINLQIEYGVPWEFVFAQFIAESGAGVAGVALNIANDMKGYNWLGHHGPDPVNGSCPNSAGKYSINKSWGPNGNNHCFRVYESIADMIGGHMFDFLRNGWYDDVLKKAGASTWDIDSAGVTYACAYVQGKKLDTCDTSKANKYWNTMKYYIKIADDVAKEKGWPTSEEVAKNNHLPVGGKHPQLGDITKDVPNHSLHYDCSAAGGGTATQGTKVDIIGDNIISNTKDKDNGLSKKLSDAAFYDKEKLALRDDSSKDNESVLDKIKELSKRDAVRDAVIVAAGSDTGKTTYAKSDLTAIIDAVGSDKKVIFVTLYDASDPKMYDEVNGFMRELASAKPNVKVADWASAASDKLVGEDKHTPADGEGVQKFSELIVSAIGSEMFNNESTKENCDCDTSGPVSGGLDEEQAGKLIDYYKDPESQKHYTLTIRTDNCVNMSGFFVQLFTDLKWASDNGVGVVHAMKNANPDLEVGTEPKPFSIFSVWGTSDNCAGCGHTGVVVAVNGDDITTIEASWLDPSFTGIKHHKLDYFKNQTYPSEVFAYLDSNMKWDALTKITGGSANAATTESTLVNEEWKDGWLSGGIEGVTKKPALESSVSMGDSSYTFDYDTNISDGTAGPNKITIESTESASSTDILDNYKSDDKLYVPHFTVDMKNKKIYQHLPVNKPATFLGSNYNLSAGIQVAILGYSSKDSSGYSADWDILSDKFGETEWSYFSMLLQALCDKYDIPKKTDQDWSKPNHLSASAYRSATGILGAMHSPDESYFEPGNIWEKANASLARTATSVECSKEGEGAPNYGEFVNYDQCDPRWSALPYSGGDMCHSACGPTSFASLISYLLGREILPTETAISDAVAYINGQPYGSKDNMSAVLIDKNYSKELEYSTDIPYINGSNTSAVVDKISSMLKDGWVIHVSGAGYYGPWTSGGHFIGIRGITEDDKWLIGDPNGYRGKANTEKEWDPTALVSGGMHYKPYAIRRKR